MTDLRKILVHACTATIQRKLEAVIRREMIVTELVLSEAEIVEVMIEVASGMTLGAILVAIQARKNGVDPTTLFDVVSASVASRVQEQRALLPEGIARVEALKKKLNR